MEVAVLGAVVGAVLNNTVSKLAAVIEKRFSELSELDGDISFLKTELAVIAVKIDDNQKGQPSALQHISMTEMRNLAFAIEDCLDKFLPCAACREGAVSNIVVFVDEVKKLKKWLERVMLRADNGDKASPSPSPQAAAGKSVGTEASNQVGMDEPKKEILGLLNCEKLQVISIVGFGGSGKTALARAVFDCDEARQKFGLRDWYAASEHRDGDELLQSLQRRIGNRDHQSSRSRCLIVIDDIEIHHWEAIKNFFSRLSMIRILLTTSMQTVAKTCTGDSGYIYNMRALSVQDSKELLKKRVGDLNTSSTDLEDGSAAIVRKCHGHPLALTSVANYLLQQEQITGQVCQDTSRLLCTRMDENKHGGFTKLRQILVNNYSSLPAHLKTCLLYTSLFPNDRPVSRKTLTSRWLAEGYIRDQRERTDQEAADDNFKELMDRNIIQPVDASNSGQAKTCKTHGIMHQFMQYKSSTSGFIATSHEKQNNFRHLIIENRREPGMDHGAAGQPAHHGKSNSLNRLLAFIKRSHWSSSSMALKMSQGSSGAVSDKKLRPRSLTVVGRAEEAVYSDLINCELLRVLDLKECDDDLNEDCLKNIYELLHLKYLTLGSSVSGLSDKMKNLHCLETLDLRKTKIMTLPLEVFSLPHLAHLFGKIMMTKNVRDIQKLDRFRSGECKLETLSGVVVDMNSIFPELMVHMKQLKKLKIWCRTAGIHKNYKILLDAIRKFAQAGTDIAQGTRSLSLYLRHHSDLLCHLLSSALHLNDSSEYLLHQGNNRNAASRQAGPPSLLLFLSSLKLQGRLTQFREFATSLCGLSELCLTYTTLNVDDLLAGLHKLKCLVYLKLVEDHLAGLNINDPDTLASLQRLCLVVQKPRFPTITEGALPCLVSLQLLCKGLEGLCDGIKVEHFKRLREVALDSEVNQHTVGLWEKEAKQHPKRPKVLLLKSVRTISAGTELPALKYIATDQRP